MATVVSTEPGQSKKHGTAFCVFSAHDWAQIHGAIFCCFPSHINRELFSALGYPEPN